MKIKKILVLHSDVPENASKDELDTLIQANEVLTELGKMGYTADLLAFGPNLEQMRTLIQKYQPDLVFNLVETLFADGQLIHVAPSLLDHLKIPYTGCSKDAIFMTSNKILSKEWMDLNQIPTPGWVSRQSSSKEFISGEYIFKSVWEHASVGLDASSVLKMDHRQSTLKVLHDKKNEGGKEFFAERYIDGREFNIALLAGKILPVPEICFENYTKGRIKIVDYKAKWDEESFEYQHTVRRFRQREEDRELFKRMGEVALKCWETFHLSGFARVDFRVDESGNPYVLEVNANPCIARDAGFFAACKEAGISYEQMIHAILENIFIY